MDNPLDKPNDSIKQDLTFHEILGLLRAATFTLRSSKFHKTTDMQQVGDIVDARRTLQKMRVVAEKRYNEELKETLRSDHMLVLKAAQPLPKGGE